MVISLPVPATVCLFISYIYLKRVIYKFVTKMWKCIKLACLNVIFNAEIACVYKSING